HARAVFAVVEDLRCLIVARLEAGNLRLAEQRRRLRRDVILVDRRRKVERSKRIERKLVVPSAIEAAYSSQSRQLYFVLEFAIETIDISPAGHVFQVGDKELAADCAHVIKRFWFLRQDVFPVFLIRIFWIKQEDPT